MSRAAKPVAIAARVKSIRADATAAHLAEIDAELRAEIEAAAAERKRLAAGRNAVLLNGDDDAIAAHDAAAAKAGHRLERTNLLLAGIAQRLADRQTQEASWAEAAKLDSWRMEGEELARSLAASLDSGYTEPAAKIAAFLAEWKAGHDRLGEINKALREAGRDEHVKTPENSLRHIPAEFSEERYVEKTVYRMDGTNKGRPDINWDVSGPDADVMLYLGSDFVKAKDTGFLVEDTVMQRIPSTLVREGKTLPLLALKVVLPPATIDGIAFWKGE